MFDYKGMSEKDLVNCCNSKKIQKGLAKFKYGVCENYSIGRIYREYADFPVWKTLYTYSEHGIEFDIVYPHEINNDAEAMFVFSEDKYENYKKISDKPCYKVIHPFVWYRRKHNINQDADAKGTIAFPAHATPDCLCSFEVNKYIEQLKALPQEMHPVCVCLFMTDVLNGLYKPFIENGISVYTAGNASDIRFVDRYYDIIRHFKYTTSNMVGSYLFFGIELGLSFSLYGAPATYFNVSDPNFEKGKMTDVSEKERAASKLFEGIHQNISEEQKQFVLKSVVPNDYLTSHEMHEIFYKAYKKRGNIWKDLFRAVKNTIKNIKFQENI